MQLPSNKVGLVLIIVVLSVASTIFFTKIGAPEKISDLQNVDLLVERKTDSTLKSGDADKDGLSDWEEELYSSDPNNSDTDADGTNDGEEIKLKRDPSIPGPNDPLITTKDLFDTTLDMSGFATGTVTDTLSIKLFTEYLNLKKEDQFTDEKQAELVANLAKETASTVQNQKHFVESDLNIISSSKETVKKYGDVFAEISVRYLIKMDSYKNLPESQYMPKIMQAYIDQANELAQIDVPDVAGDIHLEIINQTYAAGELLQMGLKEDTDPVQFTLAIAKYQASLEGDTGLYTTLAQYFVNNGIIFDSTTSINFWNYFK